MNTIMKVAVTAHAVARTMKEVMAPPTKHGAEKRDAPQPRRHL